MIARPLDLASRLRPPPQGMGSLHYVNVGLLCLFFSLFGSRFVLAPGLGLDFQLPQLAGAQAGAAQATDAPDDAALFDALFVVGLAEIEVHDTSNSLIESRPGSSGICASSGDLLPHVFLRLRWCWLSPATSSSSGTSKVSQIRSKVNIVIGRPASTICQWRTLKPYEIMSS